MIRWLRRVLPRWHTTEREIEDELAFHLEQRAEELVARGLSPAEARRAAEQEFGNLAATQVELARIDQLSAQRRQRAAWWGDLMSDLRFGLRLLAHAPGFSALLILTLALAVGANTASFTVLRAALLRGLPYHDPERLVHLWETTGDHRSEASYPDFLDWRAESQSFSALGGYNESDVVVARPEGAEVRVAGRATPGFFELLGATPVLGRGFHPEEDVPDGAPAVVLSQAYWQSRFGGDPAALDSTITLDGRPFQVIGVLPAGFHVAPLGEVDLWLTLGRTAERRSERGNHWVNVVGRLRDGITARQAEAELGQIMARLAREYPASNQGRRAVVLPLRDAFMGTVGPVLVALFAAMAVVLAIACANIASLLLARALGREQEMGVRAALGASRWRLARQLLVESLLLVTIGCILGLAFAQAGVRLVIGALPDSLLAHLPYLRSAVVDRAALGYTALLASGTVLALGFGPIVHAVKADGGGLMGRGPRTTATGSLLRLRDGLIVGEIALTLVLLTGTALVGRSLAELLRLNLGFVPDRILAGRISLSGPRYRTPASQQRFFLDLLAGIRRLPGVTSAGAITNLPLNSGNSNTFRVEGEPEPEPSARLEATTRAVSEGYFPTLGVPLVAGRLLDTRDDSAHRLSVLVNASLAARLFPGGNPLGGRLRLYAFADSTWDIVGVVGDVRTGPLEVPPPPTIYFSHLQVPSTRMALVIRSTLEPGALAREVRALIRDWDPGVPLYDVAPLQSEVESASAVAARRVPLILLGAFAGAALLVAVVGLYGVVSFNVVRRSREFGIRQALGAGPGQIRKMVLWQGAILAGAGIAVGGVLSLGLGRALQGMLFGIGPGDPVALLGAGGLLALVTLMASYLPARRATRIDPTVALRSE